MSRPTSSSNPVINLYAFDPDSGKKLNPLFQAQAGTWPNTGGNANLVPVVAAGKVFVASYSALQVFGLSAYTTALTSSPNPSSFGESVTFTATVGPMQGAGTPTGTVTFSDGGTSIGSSTLNGSGVATLTTSTLSVGTHSITASYGGDAIFPPSASPVLSQLVQGAVAGLSLTSLGFSGQPIGVASSPQNVTLTNTGNMNLTITSIQVTGTNGGDFAQTNTCGASVAANGSCNITVTFTPSIAGAENAAVTITDNGSNSPQNLGLTGIGITDATTTLLTSAQNPSSVGQSVTFTATVAPQQGTGTPTGTVSFSDGGAGIGSSTLNGSGVSTLTISTLSAGSHSITASYTGYSNFASSSSSPLPQTVNRAASATVVSSSFNPSAYGQPITLSSTVAPLYGGSATGTVTFYDGGNVLGTGNLSGNMASLTGIILAAGSHKLTASYSGDSNFLGSTSVPLTQTVNQVTTTTSLHSSSNLVAPNQPVTYTATIISQYGGAATGTVTFKDGTVTTPVSVSGGTAALTWTYSTSGTHSLTATYSGDSNNTGSSSGTLTEYVEKLPVTSKTIITTSGSPSLIAQPVTFTAAITSQYGQIPDGDTVTFFDGTSAIGTSNTAGGLATFSTPSLSAKTHTIKATYAGDPTFATSAASLSQVVTLWPTTTTLTASPNPSAYGQSVTLTATITSTSGAPAGPTGTVTFKDGTANLGSGTLNAAGVATLSTTKLAVGTSSVTATYNGDASNAKSTSALWSQTVDQATVGMTLASTLNPSTSGHSVKFTATLTSNGSLPNGQTVTFSYNSSTLGTATITAGMATFSTTTLPPGSDQVTATFGGNTNYSSASASVMQTVN